MRHRRLKGLNQVKMFTSYGLHICLHHMVLLRSQNKITDFLMISA